jgi:hypothetical protein
MSILDSFKRKKTIAELEEDAEQKEAEDRVVETEYSIAQKKMAIKELERRGLKTSHFPSWDAIMNFLKTH